MLCLALATVSVLAGRHVDNQRTVRAVEAETKRPSINSGKIWNTRRPSSIYSKKLDCIGKGWPSTRGKTAARTPVVPSYSEKTEKNNLRMPCSNSRPIATSLHFVPGYPQIYLHPYSRFLRAHASCYRSLEWQC